MLQGYDLHLINNGQAANNGMPVLLHFRAQGRLMNQRCMHATTATKVASQAFNTHFLCVQH